MPDIVFIYCIMVEVIDHVRTELKMFDQFRLTKVSAYEFFYLIILINCQLLSVHLDKSFQVRALVGFLDLGLAIKTIMLLHFT